jgi:LAS superfamily LD-carboxypeptidase LdcB
VVSEPVGDGDTVSDPVGAGEVVSVAEGVASVANAAGAARNVAGAMTAVAAATAMARRSFIESSVKSGYRRTRYEGWL